MAAYEKLYIGFILITVSVLSGVWSIFIVCVNTPAHTTYL